MGEEERLIRNLESEVRDGERCMYFVCDLNGRKVEALESFMLHAYCINNGR